MQTRKWNMSPSSREYQGRITGFQYSVDEGWSKEWNWHCDFDGFHAENCLLIEAKARYDHFLDGSIPNAERWFEGFRTMEDQAVEQGLVVRENPPARLEWYFQTPLAYQKMKPLLTSMGINVIHQP